MDGTSYFPSRPEMEANLVAFAERGRVAVRYGCRWTATRRVEGPDGERFEIETTDGVYRSRVLVLAVGVAEPYTPPGPAKEHAIHYADVQPAETYADRRVLIIGKQNSGFELATGLLPWARQLVLVSPSKLKLSVDTKTLVGVRARYVQPYEDYVLGGGVSVLDASLDRIERGSDGRLTVGLRRTDGGADLALEFDDVISATGFVAPLLDLPELGVQTVGQSRLPVQTPFWESSQDPGVVAGAVDRARVGRDAVLLEALGALADRAREVDAGHGGALPPRRLDRQPARPEGRDAEIGQVEQRRHEPGRRDDVVDLDGEVGAAVGPPQVDGQPAVGAALDPVDGGVEDADPAAQDVVLVRLDVARPDADERLRLDRQLAPATATTRTSWRAHGSRPVASSKPEFCLPMMSTRWSAYVSTGRTSA